LDLGKLHLAGDAVEKMGRMVLVDECPACKHQYEGAEMSECPSCGSSRPMIEVFD